MSEDRRGELFIVNVPIPKGFLFFLKQQFSFPHTRGSSHGQTRIFRRFYPDEHKNAIMQESYDLWRQLERESGEQLIVWVINEEIKTIFTNLKLINSDLLLRLKCYTKTGTPRPNFQKVFIWVKHHFIIEICKQKSHSEFFLQKDVPIFVASWAYCAHLAGNNHNRNTFY